jgi:hypothetical protein
MRNEQIKEITSKAIEQLIAALNEGRNSDQISQGDWPLHRSVCYSCPSAQTRLAEALS